MNKETHHRRHARTASKRARRSVSGKASKATRDREPGRDAQKPTRVLVADDHDVVRRGVRSLLQSQPGFEVCGEASDGDQAVEQAQRLRPDIAVLDITMPGLNGLEATRAIAEKVPRTRVLILTMHESEQVVREVLNAGARGYVLKSDADRDLVAALEALREGRAFFTSKVSQMVLEGYLNPSARPRHRGLAGTLTPRQREVLGLLATGKSNKEVAVALGISVKTAETHRSTIMRRLRFTSFSDLVRYAVRERIIEA
jgi:DNA-binding NarL/FixJ family response regulator